MSHQKTKEGSPTQYFTKSDLAQEKKKQVIKNASKFKEDAIEAANAPLGFCGIIAIAIIFTAIGLPLAGVLIFA